jgi:hypothetical protein
MIPTKKLAQVIKASFDALYSIQSLHRLLQPFLNILNMAQVMRLLMLWFGFIV